MNVLLGTVMTVSMMPINEDTVTLSSPLTIGQAEWLLAEHNPQIRMAWIEVEAARAALQQEQLWDNPEVSVLYNVYNPLTHRYFDAGREGELDIEFEQPIPIGGQRRERIRKQQALVAATQYRQQWTAFALRMELHRTMTDLFILQEKASLYDKELASLSRILNVYRRLAEQGNASRMEVARIEAMRLRLLSEQSEWQTRLSEREKDLRLMLGLSDHVVVESEELFSSEPPDERQRVGENSPLLELKHAETLAAEHDLRLQRSNALPNLSLKVEYDKNGNICRDFWGVGFTLSVPLFNRNQGNIRLSAATLERTRIEEQAARREIEQELILCREQLRRQQLLLAEAEQAMNTEWTLESAERQFLAHNLSLLELIDFYDAYRETRFLRLDAQQGVWHAAINLNEKTGQEIISIK